MVVVSLETGERVEGRWKPSSDTKTHIELYKAFPDNYARVFLVILLQLPLGQVAGAGDGAVKVIGVGGAEAGDVLPGLGPGHRVGAVGVDDADPAQAVYHAVVLEEVAKMALLTRQVRPSASPVPQRIQDKHYFRKHGPGAYMCRRVGRSSTGKNPR